MAHDCPDCQQMCYCDGDDTFMEEFDDCCHWEKCEKGWIEDDGDVAEFHTPPCTDEVASGAE